MPVLIWVGFLAFVAFMVALDLGVFHRKAHSIGVKEALLWTAIWVTIALLFNGVIYGMYLHNWQGVNQDGLTGAQAAGYFFTSYVLEYSLSVDNIFVIALIIANFRIPAHEQHRVLFWGVLGAVVLRGVMIGAGAELVRKFDWLYYGFGALLIYSAGKMLVASEEESVDVQHNLLVRLARKVFPVTTEFHGGKFFATINGVRHATPMFLTILLVESCDLMFAVDSIPAVLGITTDPFLAFTSNIFAILGLRSLYFALAGMMDSFRYLKMSLVFLLAFIGVKMLLHHHWKIDESVSLGIIGGILAVGVTASLNSRPRNDDHDSPPTEQLVEGASRGDSEPPI